MVASFNKIDYRVRPGKHAERYMLCDLFRRLQSFGPLREYKYVGFGSVYFSDFKLFHRVLDIQDMTSIEAEPGEEERFTWNAPYSLVNIKFGYAKDVLPKLDLKSKAILWLDFDNQISDELLADVRLATSTLGSGSILLVTVDVDPMEPTDDNSNVRKLIESLGTKRVPQGLSDRGLINWGYSNVSRRIIDDEICDALSIRNRGLPPRLQIKYKQLINMTYKDSCRMLTVGGVFYTEQDSAKLDECNFEQIEFVSTSEKAFRIGKILLTPKEIRYLEEQLPTDDFKNLKLGSIPAAEARDFEKIYRYFPSFAAIDT